MSPAVADEMGLVEWRGASRWSRCSPAPMPARFLRPGDMVTAINGQEVKSVADLKQRIAGGVQSLSIGREGMVSHQFQFAG